ncbi:hypothetical protein YTPLAS18_36400 [Nitrospira sp.]|nr:hypothetical protein YTPLAS18_36400 [Nitrospira sp.]
MLSPERGLALNGSAGEILHLCDGRTTIRAITDTLARRHGTQLRDTIQKDVLALLARLHARGLIRD